MELVGVYISTLRGARGVSQIELADRVGLSEKTIRNIEAARHALKLDDLDSILEVIGGTWSHIMQLAQPRADEGLARQLAEIAYAGDGFTEEERAYLEGLTPAQKRALLAVARQMKQ